MKKGKYSYFVEKKALETTERPRKFLEAFAAVLEHSNYGLPLEVYARISTKCSRCASACPLYEVTGEDRDIPCHRSELLLRVYRRYFTAAGILKARMFGGFTLTDEYLDRMAEEYYRCTACRRCKATCPMGVDHGLITHLSRWLLAEINVIPKALLVSVREQLEGVGNTSAIPVLALKDTCGFLEEEFRDNFNVDVKFPVDVEGAEYVFFPAVSDYLLEPDTLMGNAAVMHVTGGSWTIGTGDYDGINYGLFYSDRMMERIVQQRGRRGAPVEGEEGAGRRVRARHAERLVHPHLLRPRCAGGREHHAVHLPADACREDPAEGQDRGAGDLPRSVQHRPRRADHRGAARDIEGHLRGLRRDDSEPHRELLLWRRQRVGFDR